MAKKTKKDKIARIFDAKANAWENVPFSAMDAAPVKPGAAFGVALTTFNEKGEVIATNVQTNFGLTKKKLAATQRGVVLPLVNAYLAMGDKAAAENVAKVLKK